ncbi:hypothetical protein N656DRAFT_471857 [Canariomyces notabilis]|uniref:Uncharacterized protein n=1 Tax=Canariomyces notabilis TaxID=2074819 RepID=A0AAN6QCP3_9PEZI|nr:hypothetical protein N656DRAFT_471857 [Canariomyces arenarius]
MKIIRWFEWCCDTLGIFFDNGTAMPGKFDLLLDEIRDRGGSTEDAAASVSRIKELLIYRYRIFSRLFCSESGEMGRIQLEDFTAKLNDAIAVLGLDSASRASAIPGLEDSKGTYSSLEDILHLLHKAIRIWELVEPTQTFGSQQLAPTTMMDDNFVIPATDLHPLDDLFTYRALLMATLLSMPVDTSPLLQNEMYQQMVPFL